MSTRQKIRLFSGVLLLSWSLAAFGWVWFARDLNTKIGEWPINFWMAAQGSLLIFLGITILNAWYFNRLEKETTAAEDPAPNTAP
ncbi:MAG: DUF4212 domain-containing protein [Limnohabitans sp.]|uniref:DUF4212 domain-containing protein n=1 Tax=Limnohabitans sp. TaxID=1907725 RepID=UPI003BB1D7F5